ncbi:unnamed protein product [Onchocerca ochengi]|uniref:Transposase n=1 Tax=Onchocerca ochengi TaxID=42157 RepID=A0A182EYT2_ONCOC|nr:unnamed protein product [Onchocerca ochengi]
MEWEFIAPGAPWQGGIYERMVGVVKRSLRRAIEELRKRAQRKHRRPRSRIRREPEIDELVLESLLPLKYLENGRECRDS